MGKYRKFSLIVLVLLLACLMFMSSSDSFLEEREQDVKKISVIVNDSDDEYWANFKRGMEKAAGILNADISFNTVHEKGNVIQQMDLIKREVADAQALIISPTDDTIINRFLSDNSFGLPIVSIGNLETDEVTANVSLDYLGIGNALGEAVIKDSDIDNINVFALGNTEDRGDTNEILQGLRYRMGQDQIDVQCAWGEGQTFFKSFIDTRSVEGKKNIIVCLDIYTLEKITAIYEEGGDAGIYGVGYTDKVLHYLDTGIIDALAVFSYYDMGYLCVEYAVDLISTKWSTVGKENMFHLIRREDIYNEEYEMLLFPIS